MCGSKKIMNWKFPFEINDHKAVQIVTHKWGEKLYYYYEEKKTKRKRKSYLQMVHLYEERLKSWEINRQMNFSLKNNTNEVKLDNFCVYLKYGQTVILLQWFICKIGLCPKKTVGKN